MSNPFRALILLASIALVSLNFIACQDESTQPLSDAHRHSAGGHRYGGAGTHIDAGARCHRSSATDRDPTSYARA